MILLENKFNEFLVDKNQTANLNIEENLEKTLATIDNLQRKISELEESVSNTYNSFNMPSIVKEAEILKLELEAQTEIYKQLKAQNEILKVEISTDKEMFQILEYGEVPDVKSGPSRSQLCMVMAVLGFIVSLILAYLVNLIKIKRNLL